MVLIRTVVCHTLKWRLRTDTFNLPSKFSLIGKLFTLSFTTLGNANLATNAESVKCVNEIVKSPEDKRCYRGLQLSNNLKVLLISDPETTRSAASLNLGVGHLCDPDNVPGLAHFCEHMLFLGTEKYPNEDDYSKYVVENGGSYNASTHANFTEYYFCVVSEHLEGTLDRFAQFFLSPLFTESATQRELNAVHSEFEKNIPSDRHRIYQVEKHTSRKGHAFRKFGTGNHTTLVTIPKEKGINIREELLKFHQKWYSANLMTLVVLGKESLDDLERMVTSLFSNIPNGNVEKPEWNEHPLGPDQLQRKGHIVPIKDIKSLLISFPVPDYRKHYKSSPIYYLCFLIGHEGPGSLLSALKARGWCNTLLCGDNSEANGIATFFIQTGLTEDGLEHVDDIVTLIFQYIHMLKEEGAKKWIFEEIQTLGNTSFLFKEKERPMDYVRFLARCLHRYPLEDVLTGPYIIQEWRPDLIDHAITYLQPKNVKLTVIGKKFEEIANETEPWYGTKYRVDKIPSSTIKKWENSKHCEELKFPLPNSFITSNFEIFPLDEKANTPYPSIIHMSPVSRVWFKQDDKYLLPKANLFFKFSSPLVGQDPTTFGLTHLFLTLLKDSLNEYDYNAELAGLSWNLVGTQYGMILSIQGFNDKQGVLLDTVLERLTNFKIDAQRFQDLKDVYVRALKNFESDQPYRQAEQYLTLALTDGGWMERDLLKSVDYLTVERLQEFIPHLLSKLHIECLIHGNVDREGAFKVIDIFEKRLNAKTTLLPLLPSQLLRKRDIQLEDGANFVYEDSNNFFSSSCTEVYFQCDVPSTKNNALMELFTQIIRNPCLNTLRTKEQLGYIVSSRLKRSSCVLGLVIIVQSDRHPMYVDQRIEAFLIQFREMLQNMSQEEFERHRESLASTKLTKPSHLPTLSDRFWSEIVYQQYHFNRQEDEAECLRTITKEELLNFFDTYIDYKAPHRRKVSIYVLGKGEGGAGNEPAPDPETLSKASDGLPPPPPFVPALKIEDIIKFKSSHGLYPLVEPHMNINATLGKSKL